MTSKEIIEREIVKLTTSIQLALGCVPAMNINIELCQQKLSELKQIKQDLDKLEKFEKELKDGTLSDGYHTFNDLYLQRMYLFATIVNQNKQLAWKSLKHEDGELCFGGDWFIVGIDTPQGSYTYHYETNYWSLFDCQELDVAKHWDGHTSKDVDRLLSLHHNALRQLKINSLEEKNTKLKKALDILKEYICITKRRNEVNGNYDISCICSFGSYKDITQEAYELLKGVLE